MSSHLTKHLPDNKKIKTIDFHVRKGQVDVNFLENSTSYASAISGNGMYINNSDFENKKAHDIPVPPWSFWYASTKDFALKQSRSITSWEGLKSELKDLRDKKEINQETINRVRREFVNQHPSFLGGPIPRGTYEVDTVLTNLPGRSFKGFKIHTEGHNVHGRTNFFIHAQSSSTDTTSQGCITLPASEWNKLKKQMEHTHKVHGQFKLPLSVR